MYARTWMIAIAAILLALLLLTACTAIPTKDNPEAYTRAIVQDAIRRYKQDGRQAVIDYYSSVESVDGQWYVFIIDADNHIVGHPDPARIGINNLDFVDSAGFPVGKTMAATTEAGQWVTYRYHNPETGQEGRKHAWAIRYDGLVFGSGWYENE